jgi:hypothetical protein
MMPQWPLHGSWLAAGVVTDAPSTPHGRPADGEPDRRPGETVFLSDHGEDRQAALNDVAGTGTARHRLFRRLAESYHAAW